MTQRVHNFSPGPSTLPLPVLQKAQQDLLGTADWGMSVLEMSHRSKDFMEVVAQAEANLRMLYNIPENYRVLFMQGGASTQFSVVPLNFLNGGSADFVKTGSWANKAIREAHRVGNVNVAWDGQADNFSRMPSQDELQLDPTAAYVHITSNETIQGIQLHQTIETGSIPLICDMSSDLVSRPIELERYSMIYAGAQKNAGGSGVTIVIIDQTLLDKVPDNMHSMMNYRLMAEQQSLYNTPPGFPIYLVMLVTQWLLEDVGGLEAMYAQNRHQANMLYDTIDQSEGFYRGHAHPDSRSLMNVTWRLPSESLEALFVEQAMENDLHQLKGHRSVGGIRASIYNAMPLEGVRALCDFMKEFQKQNG